MAVHSISTVRLSPARRVGGRRRRPGIGVCAVRRRVAPTLWTLLVLAIVTVPLVVLEHVPRDVRGDGMRVISLVAALSGSSLLLAAYALPSRVRAFTAMLGVERLLRSHRTLAILVLGLVLLHVVFVVARPGIGLSVLDLRHAPPRVWAGSAALLALLLIVPLALTRRRRRPRYEGWRLAHVVLGNIVLVGTALHVWWLHDLISCRPTAMWFGGLLLATLALLVYRWWWRPVRCRRNGYVVEEVRQVTPAAVTVSLRADGHRGLRFKPGQFAWMKVGSSPFVFEEHPFTISSAATRPRSKELTIKALGDFSELAAGLRPGRRVHLDGPHGAFTVDGLNSDGFVFVAGGVGITPMLSMLRTLADRGDPRPMLLVVAGRTADDLLHRADETLLDSGLDLTVVEVLSRPPDGWDGEIGRIRESILHSALGRRLNARLDYFVCGPDPMVDLVTTILVERWQVPAKRVHTELFDVV